jgi:CHASE3 domain sensor protein
MGFQNRMCLLKLRHGAEEFHADHGKVRPAVRPFQMSDSTNRKLAAGFGIALIVLIVNAVVSSWEVQNLATLNSLVVHSREVLGELEAVVSTLREAEVGQRGFIITGQEEYAGRIEQIAVELV